MISIEDHLNQEGKLSFLPDTHVSLETAYVIEDYPYGFRLRCKMFVWVEKNKKGEMRIVRQTTNPKAGDRLNKPKASTYSPFFRLYIGADSYVHSYSVDFWRDGWETYERARDLGAFDNLTTPIDHENQAYWSLMLNIRAVMSWEGKVLTEAQDKALDSKKYEDAKRVYLELKASESTGIKGGYIIKGYE